MQPSAEFIWFGTAEGPERALVEAEGIRFYPITVAKLPRYPSMRWLTFPFDAMSARSEAKAILKKEMPAAVVSVGGFTAVPVMQEAAKYGIPCAVHQLDAVMSWSNKAVEKYCASKTTSFKREGYMQVATPTRFSLKDLPAKQPHAKPVVFVVGGGTGASALNDAVGSKIDQWLTMCDVVHATGLGKKGELTNKAGYDVRELFNQEEMKQVFADADVVITRAGIGGLADVSACSKAAIVIPIPSNQQEENAKRFKQAQAAIVVDQVGAFSDILLAEAHKLLQDAEERRQLGQTAHDFFKTDDGSELAEHVLKIIK